MTQPGNIVTPIKYLISVLALPVFLIACGSNYKIETFTTISSNDWESISDTADFWSNVVYSSTESPGSDSTTYDWSEAYMLLNSKDLIARNKVLNSQNEYSDTTIYAVEQPCVHEKDTSAFLKLTGLLFSESLLAENDRARVKNILLKSYQNGNFFKNEQPIADTSFHFSDERNEVYMKFRCELGSSHLDSLCAGKVTARNLNNAATFTTSIYIGNLALLGKLETYIISKEPIPSIQNKLIRHKKYQGKSVYYLVGQSEVLSAKSIIDGNLRYPKILVSFL